MTKFRTSLLQRFALVLVFVLTCTGWVHGYSVLTHEEIVDIAWNDDIRPLLLKRFPKMTEEDLRKAHAYAYGGAVIQDLGYYPFGSKEFSNLAHYVRSGDFVVELIKDSHDPNEYAFALGALSHYAADTEGHPAVNQSVAIEFPKLRKKYGNSVTYVENPAAHLKVEFGFDVVQVARERYAPDQYHDFIGFEVAQSLLERVVPKVYGIEFKDVIAHEELAIGTYRWSVSNVIPKMTQVAKLVKQDPNSPEKWDTSKKLFLYHLKRADYEKEWGNKYKRPGVGTRILAFFLRLIPKVGPFKALAFQSPTPQTMDLYFKSINSTIARYRYELRQVGAGRLELANLNFDTGQPTKPAQYKLTDETYAKVLDQLSQEKFSTVTPEIRAEIMEFYSNLDLPIETKKKKDDWKKVLTDLDELKAWRPAQLKAEAAGAQRERIKE
ncbi:MAG: zinc dependent phospholipase C family protein [Terriglobales bacterium]